MPKFMLILMASQATQQTMNRPRSNKHSRKRPYTEKYDGLHVTVLRSYLSVSFTEKYGDIWRKVRPFMIHVYDERIRSYLSVYGRILSFTESVMFDLGEKQQIEIKGV